MGRFHVHTDGQGHTHGLDQQHDGQQHDGQQHDGQQHDGQQHDGQQHDGQQHDPLGDHSGYESGPLRIEVLERILDENERTANANRDAFRAAGVTVVNIMSSPGAGKTTLLQRTITQLSSSMRTGVIEGDIETSLDADRLAKLGVPVALVNTSKGFGGECHLDAAMVRSAMGGLSWQQLDLLFVENVGNLVCPAEFDVGEDRRAMLYSVTEGEEKPLKYPVMFRSADIVLVNKIDLLPHLEFDLGSFYRALHDVHPGVTTIEISARTGAGVHTWCTWLRRQIRNHPAH